MRNTRRSFQGCDLCRSTSLAQLCIHIDLRYYSTFVNGRSRDVIMVEMRQRIKRADAEKEIEETIQVTFSYHRLLYIYVPILTLCTPVGYV
jgi:OHCU decarboxylase.